MSDATSTLGCGLRTVAWGRFVLLLAVCSAAGIFGTAGRASSEEPAARLVPLSDAAPPVELAPPMGELQRLTHKLSLAIGGEDLELTQFYAYEAIELLREIQREIPEYDGLPIAVWIDRIAVPAFEILTRALTSAAERAATASDRVDDSRSSATPSRASLDEVGRAVSGVVAACNDCHRATQHGFIRIVDEREHNPFNQSFERQ